MNQRIVVRETRHRNRLESTTCIERHYPTSTKPRNFTFAARSYHLKLNLCSEISLIIVHRFPVQTLASWRLLWRSVTPKPSTTGGRRCFSSSTLLTSWYRLDRCCTSLQFFARPSRLDCWDHISSDVYHCRRLIVSHVRCASALSCWKITENLKSATDMRTFQDIFLFVWLYLRPSVFCRSICHVRQSVFC